MCNKQKRFLRTFPLALITALLVLSGVFKLSGYHPMLLHFVEMGIDDYMKLFGLAEIIFALLFLLPATSKIGLLFLTAYFGGAIAMELPYGMAAAPAVPLALIWLTAFIHRPSLMMYDMKSPARKDVLTSGMGS